MSLSLFIVVILLAICVQSHYAQESLSQTSYVTNDVRDIGPDSYNFVVETNDGFSRKEEGKFVNAVWTVTGEVRWIGKNGNVYSYSFIADDKGYRQFPPSMILSGQSIFRSLSFQAEAGLFPGGANYRPEKNKFLESSQQHKFPVEYTT